MTAPILSLRDLRVSFRARDGAQVDAVRGVDLEVGQGECVALVGESGSGKSTIALATLGLVDEAGVVAAERLDVLGRDMRAADAADWRRVRGVGAGLVLQDALVSLDPLRSIGAEVEETLILHRESRGAEARARALAAMERAGLPDAGGIARRRSFELSGGMRQRALIASAIVAAPRLIVADEPTTALDAVVKAHVMETLTSMRSRDGGMLLVSHDLDLVARVADRILVVKDGRVIEEGTAVEVLERPRHGYTRELVSLRPDLRAVGAAEGVAPAVLGEEPSASEPVLRVRGVGKEYVEWGRRRRVLADVSLDVGTGSALGVVGPSGSGKSTLARILAGLLRPDTGAVDLPSPARRGAAASRVQLIPQDATSSFDPRWNVERVLAEGLRADTASRGLRGDARRARLAALLEDVGLSPDILSRRPRDLSGGQRQRIAIARALASRPAVLVCDESVSALDVAVQTRIVRLLTRLRREHGFALVFVSHDLAVLAQLCDRVVVIDGGRIVEEGDVGAIFTRPETDVARRLVEASLPPTDPPPPRPSPAPTESSSSD